MRSMEIERVLKWAYVEELPKEQELARLSTRSDGLAPGWLRMTRAEQAQQVVDEPNRYGVLPDPHSLSAPHPDALIVAEAVGALSRLDIGIPDDWNPFSDVTGDEERRLAGYGATQALNSLTVVERDGVRSLRRSVDISDRQGVKLLPSLVEALVVKHAVLGGAPDWECEGFTVCIEKGTSGRPAWFRRALMEGDRGAYEIEVDGYDYKRRRPYPDAFQKPFLDPSPKLVALGRAEYELWHAALEFLTEELDGKLESLLVKRTPRPARPWETGMPASPRILPSLKLLDSAPTI